MAWCGRPPGPIWCGKSPGLKRANPELDNDVGYGPRNPAVVMGYPGGPFLQRQKYMKTLMKRPLEGYVM